MTGRILLADDDAALRLVLSQALTKEGFSVRATSNVATLAKWVKDGEGDLVVSDVYMGEDSLFDALPGLKMARPDLPVIVMSGQSTVLTALSAAGAGAYDYLPKPFDLNDLVGAVRRALVRGPDAKARAGLASAEREERMPLIGRSASMQEVYRVLARVAATDLTVLIEGESGAGKERVARALHQYSRRKGGPFVAMSLAAATREGLEADLFSANGRLAKADRGVLYLTDVDDLSLEAQAQLLALVNAGPEDGRPRADVRLAFGSKRRLADLVRAGAFRQDLFYRLNVVTIALPPLRERLDDLADLARAFLVRARNEGLPEKAIDQSGVEALKTHDWPGNVRELENLLRRMVALRSEKLLTAREIEQELVCERLAAASEPEVGDDFDAALRRRVRADIMRLGGAAQGDLHGQLVGEVERVLIELTLEATRGNQIRAAAMLGINRNTLRKKAHGGGGRASLDD